jgi:hypothetical protein
LAQLLIYYEYEINSRLNNLYFSVRSNKLLFSNKKSSFHIIPISNFSYFIKFKSQNIGINDNNESIIYNNIKNNDVRKYIWNIFNIRKNLYFIQNLYNNKIIEVSDNYIRLSNILSFSILQWLI